MNRRPLICRIGIMLIGVAWAVTTGVAAPNCPPDSVALGSICVDAHEASVWQIPPSNAELLKLVQTGRATLADLTGGGATEVSPTSRCSPAFPTTFPPTGNWTSPLFAVSVPGVLPAGCVTWFQAEQACALSGKRLLTNQEWQSAAAGTPDPGTDDGGTDCNIGGLSMPVNTGSRAKCKSSWGVFDMVGNVEEWVADWVPQSTACPGWDTFSDDQMCLAGASTTATGPGALVRGGTFNRGFAAPGVFSLNPSSTTTQLGNSPADERPGLGFRCAR